MKTKDLSVFSVKVLKLAIADSGLTIPRVARRADISGDTLYNYLNGKTHIRSDILEKVWQALNDTVST